ncbi:WD40-repeat-containing domain protein [Chytridium lagenaria]|nr:WD40-repeat-containing domain protein [Chytridium lagenaria]
MPGAASAPTPAPVAPITSTPSLDCADLASKSVKRTHQLFIANYSVEVPNDPPSQRIKLTSKILDEWTHTKDLPPSLAAQAKPKAVKAEVKDATADANATAATSTSTQNLIDSIDAKRDEGAPRSQALILSQQQQGQEDRHPSSLTALIRLKESRKMPKPQWHAPWKLMRVISGHLGWVRSLSVDSSNDWFASGAGDRVIKIWDLASGTLKLTLTGHIATVRGLAVSPRHPYLFSCGEDKMVKCWDLEYNKVIRHYHGHLSGVYALSLHPTLDVLVTGGRDSTARVWDMRTKTQIFALTGHQSTIADIKTQEGDPQIITGSMDSTVRLWDLAAGKTSAVLTHHKKSVRAVGINPTEFTFVTASPDNIKQWRCPKGEFIQNLEGHNAIVNTVAVNQDNVLFSGADNGSMHFWDYKTGYNFQTAETLAQPGSLDSENGVFCSTFDRTGLRLITGEAERPLRSGKRMTGLLRKRIPLHLSQSWGSSGTEYT